MYNQHNDAMDHYLIYRMIASASVIFFGLVTLCRGYDKLQVILIEQSQYKYNIVLTTYDLILLRQIESILTSSIFFSEAKGWALIGLSQVFLCNILSKCFANSSLAKSLPLVFLQHQSAENMIVRAFLWPHLNLKVYSCMFRIDVHHNFLYLFLFLFEHILYLLKSWANLYVVNWRFHTVYVYVLGAL